MVIDLDILLAFGALTKRISKGDYIFMEGDYPNFYYQILEGEVKVVASNDDAKELIQGHFKKGDSFGEPPLLIDKPYPSSARALTNGVIVRLAKDKFFTLLEEYPDVRQKLLQVFAHRIYNKANTAQRLIAQTPEEKILGFLRQLRQESGWPARSLVPYTRQQLADFTGLRVETVIRTLAKLQQEKKLEIRDHKLYF